MANSYRQDRGFIAGARSNRLIENLKIGKTGRNKKIYVGHL